MRSGWTLASLALVALGSLPGDAVAHQERPRHRRTKKFVPPKNRLKRNPRHRALQSPCFTTLELWADHRSCSYNEFLVLLQQEATDSGCGHDMQTELRLMFGVTTDREAASKVWRACREAFQNKYDDAFLPFSAISGQNNLVWDKAFMDGGTSWNEERETHDLNGVDIYQSWASPNARIDPVLWTHAENDAGIQMPEDIKNFKNCALRTVMCCWVQDRQADDGNGDCEGWSDTSNGYDDGCDDANPMDNTDVCYVDMSRSPKSNRVRTGFALFETEAEDDTHCHGFAWSKDKNDASSVFRGNKLYYVSMYDHLSQRGYVRNVPGSPMCACIEQMPTVTRSDCTEVNVVEMWVGYSLDNFGFSATIGYTEVEFNDCQGVGGTTNDLDTYFQQLVVDGHADSSEYDQLKEFLVGEDNCETAIEDFLESQWMVPKTPVALPNDASGRMIYATVGLEYQVGVGASISLDGTYDGDWGFKAVACPVHKTKRCYLIVNYKSKRRLYAQKDKTGASGVGASSQTIYADQKWRLDRTTCADQVSTCYFITNDYSDRKLFAEPGASGNTQFGADKSRDSTTDRPSMKWKLEGVSGLKTNQ